MFCDCIGIILIEYTYISKTINLEKYWETFRNLQRAILKNSEERVVEKGTNRHNSARRHTANAIKEILASSLPRIRFSTDEAEKWKVEEWTKGLKGSYFE